MKKKLSVCLRSLHFVVFDPLCAFHLLFLSVTNAYKNGGKNTKCTEYNIGMPVLQNIFKTLQIKLNITKRRFFQTWKSNNRH